MEPVENTSITTNLEQAIAALQAKPTTPRYQHSLRYHIRNHHEALIALRQQGMSYEEISVGLAEYGIAIAPGTLKNYLNREKRHRRIQSQSNGRLSLEMSINRRT